MRFDYHLINFIVMIIKIATSQTLCTQLHVNNNSVCVCPPGTRKTDTACVPCPSDAYMPYYDASRCRNDKSLLNRSDFVQIHSTMEWTGMVPRIANLARGCNGVPCTALVNGARRLQLTDGKLNTETVALSPSIQHTITIDLLKMRYILGIQVGYKESGMTGVTFDTYILDSSGTYQFCGTLDSRTAGLTRLIICSQRLYGTAVMLNTTFVNRASNYIIAEVMVWSSCPISLTREPSCDLSPPSQTNSGFPWGCMCDVPFCRNGQGFNFTRNACTMCPNTISEPDTQTGMCKCTKGYNGIAVESGVPNCEDRTECTTGVHNCIQSGYTCVNTIGSFTCPDINECTTGTHSCAGSRCINTIGSFTCTACTTAKPHCDTGQTCTNSINGNFTCMDINECTMGTHSCTTGYTCNNTHGSFTCSDFNECIHGTHNCPQDGWTCVNIDGGFACTDRDECADGTHNCVMGFTCMKTVDSYTCMDVNECIDGTHNCIQSGYTCVNTVGSFSCMEIDECTMATHDCTTGFQCLNSPGTYDCIDIDECTTGVHDCGPEYTCVNMIGRFTCTIQTPQDPFFSQANTLTPITFLTMAAGIALTQIIVLLQ